jgi:hypothetical protein
MCKYNKGEVLEMVMRSGIGHVLRQGLCILGNLSLNFCAKFGGYQMEPSRTRAMKARISADHMRKLDSQAEM